MNKTKYVWIAYDHDQMPTEIYGAFRTREAARKYVKDTDTHARITKQTVLS